MISKRHVKDYCCEDISLIENYAAAIADTTQTWECHHRAEVLPCGRFTQEDLIKFGLYWKRPASELIFLTCEEHNRLHVKGTKFTAEHCAAITASKLGVPQSEAHKKANSDGHKGLLAWTNGIIERRTRECPGPDFVNMTLRRWRKEHS